MKTHAVNNYVAVTNNQRAKTNQQSFGKVFFDERNMVEHMHPNLVKKIQQAYEIIKSSLGELVNSSKFDAVLHPYKTETGDYGIGYLFYKNQQGFSSGGYSFEREGDLLTRKIAQVVRENAAKADTFPTSAEQDFLWDLTKPLPQHTVEYRFNMSA